MASQSSQKTDQLKETSPVILSGEYLPTPYRYVRCMWPLSVYLWMEYRNCGGSVLLKGRGLKN